MSVAVMIEGRVCPPGEQKISVFDRGFLYGDSVFETVRTYGGVPFELEEHLRRLKRSADLVFISLPTSLEELALEVRRAVQQADNAESYVRIMVTRGQGSVGLDPSLSDRPRRVIIASPLQPPPDEWYARGVAVISHRTQRHTDATSAEGAKVGNYLVSVLAMRRARLEGAVEALIVDGAGCVLEGGSSNVFLVRGGRVITAPEDAGILAGITRRHAITLAESLGFDVELRAPSLDEVRDADEVFITSSIREIVPVVVVDGKKIASGVPGPVTRALIEGFRRLTAGERS